MSPRGLAGGLLGTGPGETPKATALEAPSSHEVNGGMPAEEAGGIAAEKLPPAAGGIAAEVDPPNRPGGGITAGAEDGGGLAAVEPAGAEPMAALRPMPHDGCAPSTGGGLSAVAEPCDDCPVEAAETPGSAQKLTRAGGWGE